MRSLLTLFFAVALALPAHAEVPGITVTLESGEVVGTTRGLGTATLTARVTNSTARTLDGIRLAAWYSSVDVLPPADAQWLIHEFVFTPPLAPGGSASLSFSDPNAAQYVLLDARAVKYRAALIYDGTPRDLQYPLRVSEGTTFIALRDLADVLACTLRGSGGNITLEHAGSIYELTVGSVQARVGNVMRQLGVPVVQDSGRSYIALRDAALLLGLELLDLGNDQYELK